MVSRQRLKEIPLFKDFTEDEINIIAPMLKEEFYKKGKVIWEEDSPEQGLHIIDYGKVRVIKRTREETKQILAVLKENNFYGELSLLDGRTHSAAIEALEDTKVLILKRSDMEKILQENPRTAYKIVREMTIVINEILREMNDKFMKLVNYVWE
ncbi:MAG TPA: cyclic nucleotide-binding domain-containing protein [Nitrospirae bacterium]|nr:cAMP receptor protein [bacterium BMS3Abin06]HDH11609.1 cyclic nucleotide-binding domain-containing protein [Nitrospirota bacterium]HDZ02029.1 cyclic nucleotide-binding domain-containing protein [Nitrospirota bacterium]